MPKVLLILMTALLFLMTGAAYFDEWWHADQRVETFFTLPHAILYTSIFLNGMIVLCYTIFLCKQAGGFYPARIANNRELALTGTGFLLQLSAGLFDMIYHELVGFDVSVWSPPHLLAVFGGVLSATGVASLWRGRSLVGYTVAASAALSFGQFGLSEYFVNSTMLPTRFESVPAYYAILIGVLVSFQVTLSWIHTRKRLATFILFLLFISQVLVSLFWVPTKLSVIMLFPVALFGFGILFDLYGRFVNIIDRKKYIMGLMIAGLSIPMLTWLSYGNFMNGADVLISALGSIPSVLIGYWLANKVWAGEQHA